MYKAKNVGIRYAIQIVPPYYNYEYLFLNCIAKTLNNSDSWTDYAPFIYDEEKPDIIFVLASSDFINSIRNDQTLEYDIYGNEINLSVTFYTRDPILILINADNFINGVPISKLSKSEYRKYVINHETGHALGYGHLPCYVWKKKKKKKNLIHNDKENDKIKIEREKEKDICPVMYQMTKGVPKGFTPSYAVSTTDYNAPRLF